MRTAKGSKQLKLDPGIYEALQKEKVEVGDVIYIEATSGAVKRQGRSDAFATEFDLEAEEYVPLPKGDVHKRKEVVQVFDRLIAFLKLFLNMVIYGKVRAIFHTN